LQNEKKKELQQNRTETHGKKIQTTSRRERERERLAPAGKTRRAPRLQWNIQGSNKRQELSAAAA